MDGSEQVRTGSPAVDEAIELVDGLDGRPLAEHAATLGAAHDLLRGALDEPQPDA